MSLPTVVAVDAGSPAARAGLLPGDEIVALSGRVPRDVIQYHLLVAEAEVEIDVRRGGIERSLTVEKEPGKPLGAQVSSPVFDRVQTCDNHCEFCFIYQLPPALRPSLYVKDDDYRLSFLYGNFTTLTRFTEADFERVVTERLSPLYVSIHATDPEVRARMLRNRRGATSLRWLGALLEAGIEVHGQVVVCPGVNDGPVLEDTLCGVLDRYPHLATVAAVPLGVSRWSHEPGLRMHTKDEAVAVVEAVKCWQEVFLSCLGRRMVFAADEYYLLSGEPFPPVAHYEGFAQHENGVGQAVTMAAELSGRWPLASAQEAERAEVRSGFFAAVDGAPHAGYRAPRLSAAWPRVPPLAPDVAAPIAVLTGEYGAMVLRPLLPPAVRVIPVPNEFFGGNIAVTGLLVGVDLARVLADQPAGHRYLLPDVCLSRGQFLDGSRPEDLPRPVEIVPTDGVSLRRVLDSGAR